MLTEKINKKSVKKFFTQMNKGAAVMQPLYESLVLTNQLLLKVTSNEEVIDAVATSIEKICKTIENEEKAIATNHKSKFETDFGTIVIKMQEFTDKCDALEEEQRKEKEEEELKNMSQDDEPLQ